MVETITPVVHGGRTGRWALALALHVLGATVAAATFGAALGGLGLLLGAPWGLAGGVIVGAVAVAYLAREGLGLRLPVPQLRRQVPDWWRMYFGVGSAAFLYGVGLGVGFFTYLGHGTLVVVSAVAVVSGRPLVGAAVLTPFGLARGLSAVVARHARTAEEGSALVARLARSSSRRGWRFAHLAALVALVAAAAVGATGSSAIAKVWGSAAAAIVAIAFGAAGLAKVFRSRVWRRALAAYRLPLPVERGARVGVPAAELAVAALPFVGLAATAGAAALGLLGGFSAVVVLARIRVGRRLDCGCFGASAQRDYRVLLARNATLAVVAFLAWTSGVDDLGVSWAAPGRGDLVPALVVVTGVVLVTALVVRTLTTIRGMAR
jgi:hypothetical protein